MIRTKTENGFLVIYSDEGKKIRLKGTGDAHPKAIEPADGKHHQYEEVEPSEEQPA